MYTMKIKDHPENPAYRSIFDDQYNLFFNNKPNEIPLINMRVASLFQCIAIDLKSIAPYKKSKIPPWLTKKPNAIFKIASYKKDSTNELEYKSELGNLLCTIINTSIFTPMDQKMEQVQHALQLEKTLRL